MTTRSISSLKGADRVRKRPAVIFGSDGIEGCEHSMFEILSNSIDEAREGLRGADHRHPLSPTGRIEVEDFGRGIPVDYNEQGAAVQLGAGLLRAVRRRQIRQPERGQLRVFPGPQRPGRCAPPSTPREYMDVEIYRDGLQVHPAL